MDYYLFVRDIYFRSGKVGQAVRVGPRSMVENAGWVDVFNPQIRISPPRITCSPRGSCGWPAVKNAGWADVFNPQTCISPPHITCSPRGPAAGRDGLAR